LSSRSRFKYSKFDLIFVACYLISLLELEAGAEGVKHLLVTDSIYEKNKPTLAHHYDRQLIVSLYDYYTKKDEHFPQYINHLRVDYALKELKENLIL
jgi:hypothetical protein